MSLWVERKYLMLIANRLRNFKEKSTNLFNFSCPFCGDSQKNKIRARGYVYERSGKLMFSCHNCLLNATFRTLLREVDPNSYQNFSLENMREHGSRRTILPPAEIKIEYKLDEVSRLLVSLSSLPKDHEAIRYVEHRQIPKNRWKDLFFVQNFKEYVTKTYDLDPRRLERLVEDDPRLVMFLTDLSGNVTHVNGRSIQSSNHQRYVKLKVVPQQIDRKVYGLSYIDFNKKIYVVEGEIDSMFLRNAVASGDSSLNHLARALKLKHLVPPDIVLIYDNEPRNKEIMNQLKTSIEDGHFVVIWPDNWLGKDINEMVLNHKTMDQIHTAIDQNTFRGLEAILMFNDWSKR
jgi:transcription elongation factor Elf1